MQAFGRTQVLFVAPWRMISVERTTRLALNDLGFPESTVSARQAQTAVLAGASWHGAT